MKQIHRIEKQVHTGSILICTNDNKKSFKSVVWNRKSEDSMKQVKKQVLEAKLESVYNCTFYDLHSCIYLQVQSCEGNLSEFMYGPVQLDPKFTKFLENNPIPPQFYPISLVLNKNMKYSGVLTLNKNQPDLLTIIIKLQNIQIKIQHPKYQHLAQYEQLFCLSPENPMEIAVEVGKDKMEFLKSLRKMKIYCHYGNYLKIYFDSEMQKINFLFNLLKGIEDKKRISTSEIYEPKKNSKVGCGFFSQSTECFSVPKTTYRIPDSVPSDMRNVVFESHNHPEKELQKDQGVTSLQKLLTPKEPRRSYRASNNIFGSTALQYSHKLPKSQSPLNLSTPKLKQNTYARTSLNNTESKAHTKSTTLTFKQLLERNMFLQDQNRKLLQQNIKLKYRLQSLTGMDIDKDGFSQDNLVPNFIKTKQQKGKELLKSAKTFRQTEVRRETQIKKEEGKKEKIYQVAITTTTTKKTNRISEHFFGRESVFKYPNHFPSNYMELQTLTQDILQ